MFQMQAKLESEMRECERQREEVVETETQGAQAAAVLTARLEAAQTAAAASESAYQVGNSIKLQRLPCGNPNRRLTTWALHRLNYPACRY